MRQLLGFLGYLTLLIWIFPGKVEADTFIKDFHQFPCEKYVKSYEALIKELLINPFDKKALAELVECSKREDVPIKEISLLIRFADLVQYVQFLNERLGILENKNRKIILYINQTENDNSVIAEVFKNFEQPSSCQPSQIWTAEENRLIRQKGPGDIQTSIELLKKFKNQMWINLSLRQEEYRQLNQLKGLVLHSSPYKKSKDWFRDSGKAENRNEMSSTPDFFSNAAIKPLQQAQSNNSLDSLKTFQSKLDAAQERFKEMEKKATALNMQIAGMSLDLFNKDSLLSEKEQRLNEMQENLNETKSRLLLVQQLLQEKERNIEQLSDDLAKLKSTPENIEKSKDEIHSVLNQLSARLQAVNDDQTIKIRQLEENFAAVNIKYTALESVLASREREFAVLAKTQNEQKKKNDYYQKLVISGQEKLAQLEGILKIYKESYAEAKKHIEELEQNMPQLKQQQMSLENLFNDFSAVNFGR